MEAQEGKPLIQNLPCSSFWDMSHFLLGSRFQYTTNTKDVRSSLWAERSFIFLRMARLRSSGLVLRVRHRGMGVGPCGISGFLLL